MRLSKILSAGIFFLAANVALAQAPSYSNVGRTPTKEEIQAWDISIGPDGNPFPSGAIEISQTWISCFVGVLPTFA